MNKTIEDYVSVGCNVLPKNLGHCDLYFMVAILPDTRYTVGYLNKLICSYESV